MSFVAGQRVVCTRFDSVFKDVDMTGYYGHVISSNEKLTMVALRGCLPSAPEAYDVHDMVEFNGEDAPWPFFPHELEAAD